MKSVSVLSSPILSFPPNKTSMDHFRVHLSRHHVPTEARAGVYDGLKN